MYILLVSAPILMDDHNYVSTSSTITPKYRHREQSGAMKKL